ncbi:putative solute carrier family 35 member SLC35F1/F2/F6 [Helianthus anomalus]
MVDPVGVHINKGLLALVNEAFQFSSITSVTILDCATVIWVIILTWFFLGTTYSLWQFLGGSSMCGTNLVLGDALVIAGTCFFAFSNVGEEYCVKKVGRIEVVAMLGLFGMLVSLTEMYPFLLNLRGPTSMSCFMFTSLTPLVLQASGATLFNLSLLTADIWTEVIRVFLYHQKVIFQKSECTCGFIQWRIQEFILHVYQLELQIWER